MLTSAPPAVDFGRESVLAQPLAPQRLLIKTAAAVHELTATCTCSQCNVTVEKYPAKTSNRFDLIVRPDASLPVGKISGHITLLAKLKDGSCLPAQEMKIEGTVVRDIEASPGTILLGARPVGVTVEETISLRSLTGKRFTVTGVRCEGNDLSIERVDKVSSFGPTFRIKQKIAATGERTGNLIFSVCSKGTQEYEVIVPLLSYGIENTNN